MSNPFSALRLLYKKITSQETYLKGLALSKKVELVNAVDKKRLTFQVKNHYVVFNIERGTFTCDCPYFALSRKPCSHIIAVVIYLERLFNRKGRSYLDLIKR